MIEPPNTEDEKRRDEILKRMLKTPPKHHNKGVQPKPDAPKLRQKKDKERQNPKASG